MKRHELEQIAAAIEKAFIPFAFTCDCDGANKSCAQVLTDDIQVAKMFQVKSIGRFIREMDAQNG